MTQKHAELTTLSWDALASKNGIYWFVKCEIGSGNWHFHQEHVRTQVSFFLGCKSAAKYYVACIDSDQGLMDWDDEYKWTLVRGDASRLLPKHASSTIFDESLLTDAGTLPEADAPTSLITVATQSMFGFHVQLRDANRLRGLYFQVEEVIDRFQAVRPHLDIARALKAHPTDAAIQRLDHLGFLILHEKIEGVRNKAAELKSSRTGDVRRKIGDCSFDYMNNDVKSLKTLLTSIDNALVEIIGDNWRKVPPELPNIFADEECLLDAKSLYKDITRYLKRRRKQMAWNLPVSSVGKSTGEWKLCGRDTFALEDYHISNFATEELALQAARSYLDNLERRQPTATSGGQAAGGIQDRLYIIGPDGAGYRYMGEEESEAE